MTLDIETFCNVVDRLGDSTWGDGLPLVPPTRSQVEKFVQYSRLAADDVIAEVPPLLGKGTVEKIAANAVMAGCRPEHMPVIIAALEAMPDPRLNAAGMLCSMHSAIPLLVINGPIRTSLNINSGYNVFGQGWRANATIGRAVNLILMNIGGARPGQADRSIFGQPGNYTFCIAENEEASPWEPFHVDQGLPATDSAVTLIGAEPPHLCMFSSSDRPWDILANLASHMTNLGSVNPYYQGQSLVVLSPEAAAACSRAKWQKKDVQQFLFEKARVPHSKLKNGPYGAETNQYFMWPRWIDRRREDEMVPVARRPEDILILVAGGYGTTNSVYLPSWGTRSVTRKITI